jgi:hypothetical protein
MSGPYLTELVRYLSVTSQADAASGRRRINASRPGGRPSAGAGASTSRHDGSPERPPTSTSTSSRRGRWWRRSGAGTRSGS